jgi:hypothetical protein
MTKARSLSDFIESDGSVTLVDNQKIKVGTGNDLQIYHDGNNKIEATSGYLRLAATTASTYVDGNNVHIRSGDGGETLARFNDNSDVKLYYDNDLKLATTSTGVDVTGVMTASAGITSSAGTVQFSDGGASFDSSDSNGYPVFKQTNGSAQLALERTGSATGKGYIGADSASLFHVYNSSFAKKFDVSTDGNVNVTGSLTVDSSATFATPIAVGQTSFSGGSILADFHGSGSGVGAQLAFANDHNTDKFYVGLEGNTTGDGFLYQQKNADINFYTNNAFAAKLDNSGNFGINTQSPTAKLDVRGSVNSEHAVFTGGTNSNRGLSIQTAASGGQQDAGVIFDAQDTEGGANPYIQLKSAGQTVATFSKGSTDKYPSSGGLGGIGGNGANLQLDADDSEIRMANNIIHSDNSGATKFSIRAAYGALNSGAELSLDGGHITFNAGTSFTQVGRFDTDGLKFGSDTAAVNGLDDYEEGTATLTMSAITTAPTITQGNTFTIAYTKIGNLVRFVGYSGARNITNVGTGGAKFTGLPFAQAGSYYGHVTFAHTTTFSTTVSTGYIESGNTFFYPITTGSTNAANYATGTRYVMVAGIYHVG